jgi:hypothetical protein
MRNRPATTIVLTLLSLILVANAVGQFGNFSIIPGVIPCVVACGDKGVINLRAPGELVSNIFSGPTVDNFRDQSMSVVAEADKRLSATLDKERLAALDGLKDQREKLIIDLRSVSNTSLEKLDDILDKDLARIEQAISSENGVLQDIAELHTVRLEAVLRRVTIFLISFGFLGALAWTLYRERKNPNGNRGNKPFWKTVGAKSIIAALGCLAFWLAADFVIDRSLTRTLRISTESRVKAYNRSLADYDYPLAVDWASRLHALEAENYLYEAMLRKAELLRDIYLRPSIYKTTAGANQIFARVSQTQLLFKNAKHQRDPDVDVVSAVVSWQEGAERFAEYVSATTCASALKRSKGSDRFSTAPIAKFYLDSYLDNPLSDDDLAALQFNIQQQNSGLQNDGFRYMTLKELLEVRAENPVSEVPETSPFATQIMFGMRSRSLYRRAIPLYLDLALTEARLSSADAESKSKLRQQRKELAQAMFDLWANFEREVVKNKLYGIGLQSSLLRSQFAIFSRAAMYRIDGAPDTVPEIAADDGKSPVAVWLASGIKPNVSDQAFEVFQLAANSDFQERQKELKEFEDKLNAHLLAMQAYATQASDTAQSNVLKSFREVNEAASRSGLFACGTSYVDMPCSDPNKPTIPAYAVIIANTPGTIRPAELPPSVRRTAADRRVLPVI